MNMNIEISPEVPMQPLVVRQLVKLTDVPTPLPTPSHMTAALLDAEESAGHEEDIESDWAKDTDFVNMHAGTIPAWFDQQRAEARVSGKKYGWVEDTDVCCSKEYAQALLKAFDKLGTDYTNIFYWYDSDDEGYTIMAWWDDTPAESLIYGPICHVGERRIRDYGRKFNGV